VLLLLVTDRWCVVSIFVAGNGDHIHGELGGLGWPTAAAARRRARAGQRQHRHGAMRRPTDDETNSSGSVVAGCWSSTSAAGPRHAGDGPSGAVHEAVAAAVPAEAGGQEGRSRRAALGRR
jgi:hypothetical protein